MLLMGVCQTIQMDGLILVFERMHYGSLFSVIYIKVKIYVIITWSLKTAMVWTYSFLTLGYFY